MKSDEFESRINDLLDRRIAPTSDPEIVEAAQASAELRAVLASYATMMLGVERLAVPACPANLAEQVVGRLREERRAPAATILSLPQRTWYLTAAAAAVVLAAIPLIRMLVEPPTVAVNQLPAPAAVAPIASAPAEIVPSVETGPADVAKRQVAAKRLAGYADMVRRTGVAIADLALLMPELPLQSELPSAVPSESTEQEEADMVEQVGQGFEPLANSAVGALDFLFKVLPQGDGSRS